MGFDENPPSPDRLVRPEKRTTQVNFGVAAGVLLFFVIGGIAIWWVARNSP